MRVSACPATSGSAASRPPSPRFAARRVQLAASRGAERRGEREDEDAERGEEARHAEARPERKQVAVLRERERRGR